MLVDLEYSAVGPGSPGHLKAAVVEAVSMPAATSVAPATTTTTPKAAVVNRSPPNLRTSVGLWLLACLLYIYMILRSTWKGW